MTQKIYHKSFSLTVEGDDKSAKLYAMTEPPTLDEIRQWEVENEKLPDSYIKFLLKYNGGYVFPASFHHNTKDPSEFVETDDITGVENFLNWELFKDHNEYQSERREKMLMIGYDYTSSAICISIEEHNYGQILYWWRNLSGAWDVEEDGPYPIGVIANNFREFIFEKLFDEDGSAPRWYIPKDLETANIVEF